MHAHYCPNYDYGLVKPGDAEMERCQCAPISKEHRALASRPCAKPCVDCMDGGHHWMPECDEDNGEPVMICKHCDARREYTDDDIEI